MYYVRRALWFLVHGAWSVLSLVIFCLDRRGGPMVFTHWADRDEEGLDRKMGPLVDRLEQAGERLILFSLVPLGHSFLKVLRTRRRRLFISYGTLVGVARVLTLFRPGSEARRLAWRSMLAELMLAHLRPSTVFVADEAKTGQSFVRAARRLGIPVVGIQHGDFRADDPEYTSADTVPVDLMCVWSEWFRERLLAVSPSYDPSAVTVTGRLRYPPPPTERHRSTNTWVLFLTEGHDDFRTEALPFIQALREADDVSAHVRRHPGDHVAQALDLEPVGRSLVEAILTCDVAVGVRSAALLEALWHGRPAIVLATASWKDPGGYGDAGVAHRCDDAAELADLCRRLAAAPEPTSARETVWGGAPEDAAGEILRAAERLVNRGRRENLRRYRAYAVAPGA